MSKQLKPFKGCTVSCMDSSHIKLKFKTRMKSTHNTRGTFIEVEAEHSGYDNVNLNLSLSQAKKLHKYLGSLLEK